MTIPRVILLVEKSRAFGRNLLAGIARFNALHGPWIFHETPVFYRDDHKTLRSWLWAQEADALIGHVADARVTQLVQQLKIPTVLCNVESPAREKSGWVSSLPYGSTNALRTLLEHVLRGQTKTEQEPAANAQPAH